MKMNVRFLWVGGATWILQAGKTRIACDPVLCPKGHVQDYGFFRSERLNDPVYRKGDFADIDLWLLTHRHEDHFDNQGLRVIQNGTKIVAHQGLYPLLKDRPEVFYLKKDRAMVFHVNEMEILVQALPAVHARYRIPGGLVGNGNGYRLEISDGKETLAVYVTGDSVYKKTVRKYFPQNPDLIIANAGGAVVKVPVLGKMIGRITNNNHDLVTMAKDLQPKVLIPVHWGTFSHYMETVRKDSFTGIACVKTVEPGKTEKLL